MTRSRLRRITTTAALAAMFSLLVINPSHAATPAASSTSPVKGPARAAVQGHVTAAAAAADDQHITFSEYPIDTSISTQYQPEGIVFGGDAPFITDDGANPTSPVLSGSPRFEGAITGTFVNADGTPRTVNSFTVDVGYIDTAGTVAVTAYDKNSTVLQTIVINELGIVTVPVEATGIASFRVAASGDEPAGFAIDNVGFPGLFPCPTQGTHTPATLPQIDLPDLTGQKPATIEYGQLPLSFNTIATAPDAVCSVVSSTGVLPVRLVFTVRVPFHTFRYVQQIAESVAIASVDFFPATAAEVNVPTCNFSVLAAAASLLSIPVLGNFSQTNNCALTPISAQPGEIVARWHTSGFNEYSSIAPLTRLYTTQPLTFYTGLSAVPGLAANSSFPVILQQLEEYLHRTLVANLPMIDKLMVVQDPPAHLQVTDPLGRHVGITGNNTPGGGYAEIGGRSIAWFLEPVAGTYTIVASGAAGSTYSLDAIEVQLLGHGLDPLTKNASWSAKLPASGHASHTFTVTGAAIAPVLVPTAKLTGHATCAAGTQAAFTLGASQVPLGIASVEWSFGDGGSADGSSVMHSYLKAGVYRPSVTVTDLIGDVVTTTLAPLTIKKCCR